MDTLTLISPKQANENFKNGITQAKIMKKHNGGDCSESKLSSFTLAHSFAGVLYSTLILFKDYLRHLGMVAMAAVVAILACSLKGNRILILLHMQASSIANYQRSEFYHYTNLTFVCVCVCVCVRAERSPEAI